MCKIWQESRVTELARLIFILLPGHCKQTSHSHLDFRVTKRKIVYFFKIFIFYIFHKNSSPELRCQAQIQSLIVIDRSICFAATNVIIINNFCFNLHKIYGYSCFEESPCFIIEFQLPLKKIIVGVNNRKQVTILMKLGTSYQELQIKFFEILNS